MRSPIFPFKCFSLQESHFLWRLSETGCTHIHIIRSSVARLVSGTESFTAGNTTANRLNSAWFTVDVYLTLCWHECTSSPLTNKLSSVVPLLLVRCRLEVTTY